MPLCYAGYEPADGKLPVQSMHRSKGATSMELNSLLLHAYDDNGVSEQ
jgi:hypothetical protein